MCADCNFDSEVLRSCGWTDISPDAWAWYRREMGYVHVLDPTGPEGDHTTGSATGIKLEKHTHVYFIMY